MNAVYFNTRSGPEALVYGPATMPGAGKGEIVVRVRAADRIAVGADLDHARELNAPSSNRPHGLVSEMAILVSEMPVPSSEAIAEN